MKRFTLTMVSRGCSAARLERVAPDDHVAAIAVVHHARQERRAGRSRGSRRVARSCTYATSELVVPRSMPIGRGGALGSKISSSSHQVSFSLFDGARPRRGSAGRTGARREAARASRTGARVPSAGASARANCAASACDRRRLARRFAVGRRAFDARPRRAARASASASRCSSTSIRKLGVGLGLGVLADRDAGERKQRLGAADGVAQRAPRLVDLDAPCSSASRRSLAAACAYLSGCSARDSSRCVFSSTRRGRDRSGARAPSVANGSA